MSNLNLIEQVCSSICSRNGVYGDDAEEFNAEVRLKLLDQDYAVFRKFRNTSTLTTYLTAVINNLFRDYRIKKWGKWRPSAKAKKLGQTAVLLETLISRDGYSQDQACTMLRQRGATALDPKKLAKIAAQLPMRPRRRIEGEEGLARVAAPERTNGAVIEGERVSALESAEVALRSALATLPDEDQVIIKLQYFEGFTVADIARALHLKQKPLYERIKKNLKQLRHSLERQGVNSHVLELIQ